MTVVVDNCLPVSWADYLMAHGHAASHWRELGNPSAPDMEIMNWAREHQAVVLTQDLDFTKLLFQSRASMPSVIQLRLADVRPKTIGPEVLLILAQQNMPLERGALITVNGRKSRLRLLPLVD